MALVRVYADKKFLIWSTDDNEYILVNKFKPFKNGHTHLRNFKTAKWLIELYNQKRIPRDLHGDYLLKSLVRISDDPIYTKKVESLIEIKKNKSKPYYINVQKGTYKRS